MWKHVFMTIAMFFLLTSSSQACVGRILKIGALDSPQGKVLAETLALLITERTGTTVEIKHFPTTDTLYAAVRDKDVGILVEGVKIAMDVLGLPPVTDDEQALRVVKDLYRQKMNLVWLDPFFLASAHDGQNTNQEKKGVLNAPVLSFDVVTDFPGLPRLLNKLAGRLGVKEYTAMVDAVASGKDPKTTARAFLEAQKLI